MKYIMVQLLCFLPVNKNERHILRVNTTDFTESHYTVHYTMIDGMQY